MPNEVLSPSQSDCGYAAKQSIHAREYDAAWASAPPEFLEAARVAGVAAMPNEFTSMAMEFNDGYSNSTFHPDLAASIDTRADELIEKHGAEYASVIRAVADEFTAMVAAEAELTRALTIARVVGVLIKSESRNVYARLHGLAHAIPRLASVNGISSMRVSARACGVSVEWIRRSRDGWAKELGIPVPVAGTKTAQAKERYKQNGHLNHWKQQTCTTANLKNLW